MQNILIGSTGFVGSNLAAQFRFDLLFNSSNITSIAGGSFGVLVFAGAQSKKWWANEHAEADWLAIQRAIDPLAGVSATRAVLISTIDVIPSTSPGVDERVECRLAAGNAYGRNRLRLEQEFCKLFPNALVVRLPALFGPGLKKNVVYDLLHDNMLATINQASTFQYYDLDRLWPDIELAMSKNLDLVHLFTEPIRTQDIVARFFPDKIVGIAPVAEAHYDFRTRYDQLFGGSNGYIEGSAGVLARLGAFISMELAKVSR